jgi:hypothetical protein
MNFAWSNKHLSPNGTSLEMVDRRTGRIVRPRVVNSRGKDGSLDNVVVVPRAGGIALYAQPTELNCESHESE